LSYSVDFTIYARSTGLSLAAQLVDYAGDNVGSEITEGFIELAGGYYAWRYASVPADFAGQVKFYPQGDPTDCWFAHLGPDDSLWHGKSVETGVTFHQSVQRIGAAAAGEISGAGTGTETAKGLDGSTDRVQATVDASGNRTEVSYDP